MLRTNKRYPRKVSKKVPWSPQAFDEFNRIGGSSLTLQAASVWLVMRRVWQSAVILYQRLAKRNVYSRLALAVELAL